MKLSNAMKLALKHAQDFGSVSNEMARFSTINALVSRGLLSRPVKNPNKMPFSGGLLRFSVTAAGLAALA